MTPTDAQLDTASLQRFADRMRQLGMLVVRCDPVGQLADDRTSGDDWLARLLLASSAFRSELREAVRSVGDCTDVLPINVPGGLAVVPLPIIKRKRCHGYVVVVIVTSPFLTAGDLPSMCAATGLDPAQTASAVAELPPASLADVPRIATMVGHAYHDLLKISGQVQAVETVGRQLGDTYEEISFLYSIIQNIRVVERPDRFVSIACVELLETLPYRWIGARFVDDGERVRHLADKLILTGQPELEPEALRDMTTRLLNDATLDSPIVLDPARPEQHVDPRVGSAVLVHPIAGNDRILGLLMAGDKQGPDRIVSSVDMKLLGATAAQLAIFLENAALYHDLNAMFLGTLEALTASIDAKDRYTHGHSQRVARLTAQLAEAAGLDEHTIGQMHIAGLVHDVGKIGVPERVLQKPGRLSREEFGWIRRHPEMGYRILKDIPKFKDILPGVLHHHERWDGKGYPTGLAGTDIPLAGRLIALADSFDAMSSTRTYRDQLSRSEVIAEIEQCAGSQFDPDLVPLFLTLDFSEFDRLVQLHQDRDAERGAA